MNEPLVFTVEDLRAVLEPDLGPLHELKIVPQAGPTKPARWSALNMDADLVEGGLDVQLEQQDDGSFLLKPIVTITGASGRELRLPWPGAASGPSNTARLCSWPSQEGATRPVHARHGHGSAEGRKLLAGLLPCPKTVKLPTGWQL